MQFREDISSPADIYCIAISQFRLENRRRRKSSQQLFFSFSQMNIGIRVRVQCSLHATSSRLCPPPQSHSKHLTACSKMKNTLKMFILAHCSKSKADSGWEGRTRRMGPLQLKLSVFLACDVLILALVLDDMRGIFLSVSYEVPDGLFYLCFSNAL